jgi:DNA modification methylase
MAQATITFRHQAPQELKPHPKNPRTHSRAQLDKLSRSIDEMGLISPVVVDECGTILAGHARYTIVQERGLSPIPIIEVAGLTEPQKLSLMLADNRLPLDAGWDEQKLSLVLEEILEIDNEFDLELSGFDVPEIDILLDLDENEAGGGADLADHIPETPDEAPTVSRYGDLWILGRSRLLCGDATSGEDIGRLLDDEKATITITDPPYNVSARHIGQRSAKRHGAFVMASGEMSEAEYTAFLEAALSQMASVNADGGLLYVFIDWRHLYELLSVARTLNLQLINLCVWAKTNGGMGSFYRSQHELVLVLRSGKKPHRNNVELGRHGRNRTNLWTYPGVNTFRDGRMEELAMHPTVKPVALVADAIRDASRRGDIVLDPFAGSGTTLIAAERTGRRGYGMDLDPRYVDTAIRRWQHFTGEPAILAGTGLTFTQAEAEILDRTTVDEDHESR